MAAGCAVIASDAGGPSEIVTNEIDGLLVPPEDVEALGDAMRRLFSDPELRQRLAKAGLERAEDFLPGKVARQVAEFQSRIVSAAGCWWLLLGPRALIRLVQPRRVPRSR
jgi:glycosyltransferase involved in cell wall biosynthesis